MGTNPSRFKDPDRPIERVSWYDIQEFIDRINRNADCNRCSRLPTEAEWEYAARAESSTPFSFGKNENLLGEYAWYSSNAESSTQPVARKKKNDWGLYDMHGNVWEWVQDWYGEYGNEKATDPTGPSTGTYRVIRGGGWISSSRYLHSSSRGYDAPGDALGFIGFRLVRTIP